MPEMRADHLAWCKGRALEYVDDGDLEGALASLASDLRKHPQTKPSAEITFLGVPHVLAGDGRGLRHFIEGFN
jgi:hypothetical protein